MIQIKDKLHSIKKLRKRYITALAILLFLIIGSHLVVAYANRSTLNDSGIINIAGRQRMLSQKITKAIYGLYLSKKPRDKMKYKEEIAKDLALWISSHKALKNGDRLLDLPSQNSDVVNVMFSELDSHFMSLATTAQKIIELTDKGNPSVTQLDALLDEIREHEAIYLPIMNQIVFQYDDEARQRVHTNHVLNIFIGIMTILTILLELLFIFIPMEKEVKSSLVSLIESEEYLQKLFDIAPQIMFLIDPISHRILRINMLGSEAIGVNFDEALALDLSSFIDNKYLLGINIMEENKFHGKISSIEVEFMNIKKEKTPMLMSASRVFFHQRSVVLVGLTDITEQKKQEQVLEHFASIDELTGIANRRTGMLLLEKGIEYAKRKNMELVLCFIDIDGLKLTNDSLGHDHGDLLIKNVANILSKNTRAGDIVFRYGGDEIIIIFNFCRIQSAEIVMERINLDLKELNQSKRHDFKHEISYGMVEYDIAKFENSDSIIEYADKLMYANKHAKKNNGGISPVS